MKRFRKVYIEITNVCNLSCSFCPGTQRQLKFMTTEEFGRISEKIAPYTDYIYLHLMGEPLLHPDLPDLIDIVGSFGLRTCITTNGTLLQKRAKEILTRQNNIHKISISLQAQEANANVDLKTYLDECFSFGKQIEGKTVLVYRLWNEGGENKNNGEILAAMHEAFSGEWTDHPLGAKIGDRVYLENGEKFDWPDPDAPYTGEEKDPYFCYGLSDHIGILADGTVVPCCLDNEGRLVLGNIYLQDMTEILQSERAVKMREGFLKGAAEEDLCRRCGYAKRFIKSQRPVR